ncbi:MAG TPA: GntR family transcriptional regulator [Burkholderiales bacterium]|nr:GntR family transcriptional regulator [Burkholderiales bacterium]
MVLQHGFSAPAPRGEGAPLTQSLPEQIAARLSERIITGRYAPGQRVLEQAIAAEFAVSRGPVREALRLLERDGLVTILPRRGAQVTNLSAAEVREIFDIRAQLNGLRDRELAEDPDRMQLLPALEAQVAQLTRCARQPAMGEAYVETVFALNRMLTHASRNRRLRTILDSLALQTLRYSRLGLSSPQRRRQSVQHWQKLVKAIRDGDGAAAERVARQRVLDSRDAAIRALEAQGADAAPPGRHTRRAA